MPRLPRNRYTLAGTAVVVAVVVILASLAGAVADAPGVTPTEHPEYDAADLVPERADAGGTIDVSPVADAGTIVIDRAHANRYQRPELEPLTAALSAAGAEVVFVGPGDDLAGALDGADAFVVIDPGVAYSREEADDVEDFVADGGRLLLLGEPTRTTVQQIGFLGALVPAQNRLGPLASRFGIQFGDGYLFNMASNDGNHVNIYADAPAGSGLAAGVDRAALYTSTTVSASDGTPVLVAEAGTRNARNDVAGEYPVAVRDGNVLAVGDATFLTQGYYSVVDNGRFIGNVARFLVNADRRYPLRTYPGMLGDAPRVRFTEQGLTGAAQALAGDLRDHGKDPRVTLSRGGFAADRTDVLVTTYDYLEARDVAGIGIDARAGRVSAGGYSSDTEGVIVIRAPSTGIDLVVVVDDVSRGDRAVEALTTDGIEQYQLTARTAVVRTDDAEPAPDDAV